METPLRLAFDEGLAMSEQLAEILEALSNRLVASLSPDGFWEGELSSSALSTATAVSALALAGEDADAARLDAGIKWLADHQNADGGWGDTADSPSNLATTLLVVSAINLFQQAYKKEREGEAPAEPSSDSRFPSTLAAPQEPRPPERISFADTTKKSEEYLTKHQATSPKDIIRAVQCEYGKDRTFAIPILMNCALAGLVDWAEIPGLPFELAIFPHAWYKIFRLHVVSYALPALIAIGLLLDRRHPSRNILKRWLRKAVTRKVLAKLGKIQPHNGGFLEAVPLTSFTTLGLLPLFGNDHSVVKKCLGFLRRSQRPDGSWPIDSNLSVWLTTSAVAALSEAGHLHKIDGSRTAEWIVQRQYKKPLPYTHATPGGWGWTHLPGGVPDVDDTSGAILAIAAIDAEEQFRPNIDAGVRWLLELQNSDGGWPTFCRGWGKLPFDKSTPDLTAHALRALACANPQRFDRSHSAVRKGLRYLSAMQQSDGSWLPLWFGNQAAPDRQNPVIGTSFVLRALEIFDLAGTQAARARAYLVQVQNLDGGWGGAKSVASSLEETALVAAALTPWAESPEVCTALSRCGEFFQRETATRLDHPSPIGLYFSHLWYSEKFYPLIWTVEALGRLSQTVVRDNFD
jgi:squalene-hopene/tetraprenyl-beta-curcumene cyclase